jgi:hypothetical protein
MNFVRTISEDDQLLIEQSSTSIFGDLKSGELDQEDGEVT